MEWFSGLIAFGVLAGGIVAIFLCRMHDVLYPIRRIFSPHMHELVVEKWLEEENLRSNLPTVAFTDQAVKFIDSRYEKGFSIQIIVDHRYVGSPRGISSLPCVKVEFGARRPGIDFVRAESETYVPLLMTREIYDVLKHRRSQLTVTASGFHKAKKLVLKEDLSWILYSEQEMRRGNRWPTLSRM